MLKKRKAQGMSIRILIVAVIGLIILVVVVGIFTGRINIYSAGVKELTTCENTCKNIGYKSFSTLFSKVDCKTVGGHYIPGTYSDATGTYEHSDAKKICCCENVKNPQTI